MGSTEIGSGVPTRSQRSSGGDGDTSRVARFTDPDDLAAKTEALRGLMAAWILSRD
jgi:hypothetical protein